MIIQFVRLLGRDFICVKIPQWIQINPPVVFTLLRQRWSSTIFSLLLALTYEHQIHSSHSFAAFIYLATVFKFVATNAAVENFDTYQNWIWSWKLRLLLTFCTVLTLYPQSRWEIGTEENWPVTGEDIIKKVFRKDCQKDHFPETNDNFTSQQEA